MMDNCWEHEPHKRPTINHILDSTYDYCEMIFNEYNESLKDRDFSRESFDGQLNKELRDSWTERSRQKDREENTKMAISPIPLLRVPLNINAMSCSLNLDGKKLPLNNYSSLPVQWATGGQSANLASHGGVHESSSSVWGTNQSLMQTHEKFFSQSSSLVEISPRETQYSNVSNISNIEKLVPINETKSTSFKKALGSIAVPDVLSYSAGDTEETKVGTPI